jgi:hypothetical protein
MDFTNEFDVVSSNATLHWIKTTYPSCGVYIVLSNTVVLLQMGGKDNAMGMIKAALQATDYGLRKPACAPIGWNYCQKI